MVLMLKEPRPGRVKTRLGQSIGMTGAAWWFRHQTRALIRRLDDPRWQMILAVAPDHAGMASRVWPEHLPRLPQGAGDLGDRMARIFRSLGPGPALIIGGDIPGITKPVITSAFGALGAASAVLGPVTDGGYWGVGLKRPSAPPAGLFEGVRWSTEHALADTAQTLPHPVAVVETLRDVDTLEDLQALRLSR